MKSYSIQGIIQDMKQFALILCLFLGTASSATARDADSRLLVFLEVPVSCRTEVHLELAGLTLNSPDHNLELPLSSHSLNARDLAGKRFLLSEARIPGGDYHGLHFDFKEIRGRIGVAPVRLPAAKAGLDVELNLSVPAETCAMVVLTWDPHPLTADTLAYSPVFGSLQPEPTPRGALAFVTCRDNGILQVFDRLTWQPVAALFLAGGPGDMAYSQRRQQLFVSLIDSDEIAVVDAVSLQVVRRVALGFGDRPTRLLVSRDEETLFLLNAGTRTLVGLSLWSLQENLRVPLGEQPRDLAEDPVTRYIYITDEFEGRIQVFDPATGREVGNISQPVAPVELEFAPLGRQLFASSSVQNRIFHLDLETGEGGDSLGLCGKVMGLAYNPRFGRLYASLSGCGEIAVISPALDLEFAGIRLDDEAGYLAFDNESRLLLAVLLSRDAIAVCSANQGAVTHIVPTCSGPYAVISP